MILRLAIALLRLRRHQLERRVARPFAKTVSLELDRVVAALEALGRR